MELHDWGTLAGLCAAGAASPGPSLVLVLGWAARAGRGAAVGAALGHGLGVGIYAAGAAAGLGAALAASPVLAAAVQLAGALWLGRLAWGLMRPRAPAGAAGPGAAGAAGGGPARAAREGFLLAFLNPKIAVFFLALFAPWSARAAGLGERLAMGLLAGCIDAGWYALVAVAAGGAALARALERHRARVDRAFGVLLLGVAVLGALAAVRGLGGG